MRDADRLDDLLLLWEELHEEGQDVPAEQLCRDCPELAGALAERIAQLKRMGWLNPIQGNGIAYAEMSAGWSERTQARVQRIADRAGVEVSVCGRRGVGTYVLSRWLGGGSFGEVWAASDLIGCEAFAVKFVDLAFAEGEMGPRPSQRELDASIYISAYTEHPFVLPIHGAVETEAGLALIYERAHFTLADAYLKHDGLYADASLDERLETCLFFLLQAAGGLDYINRRLRFQHLDVKPSNLLYGCRDYSYSPMGRMFPYVCVCWIGDFGSATRISRMSDAPALVLALPNVRDGGIKSIASRSYQEIPWDQAQANAKLFTATGGITPYYAPPEAFDGRFSDSFDQYCLALTFTELVAKRSPFTGSLTAQIDQKKRGKLDLGFLPAELREPLLRALSPTPECRFPSCLEFIKELCTPLIDEAHVKRWSGRNYGWFDVYDPIYTRDVPRLIAVLEGIEANGYQEFSSDSGQQSHSGWMKPHWLCFMANAAKRRLRTDFTS